MKTTKKDPFPLHQPLRVWQMHTGVQAATLCRRLKRAGINLSERKEQGVTLQELILNDCLWPLVMQPGRARE